MKVVKYYPPELLKNARRVRNNRNKVLREYLMADDSHCYWCGIEVIYFVPQPQPYKRHLPHNFATIDHKISRFFRKKGEVVEKVLACQKCNHERQRKEQYLLNQSNQ